MQKSYISIYIDGSTIKTMDEDEADLYVEAAGSLIIRDRSKQLGGRDTGEQPDENRSKMAKKWSAKEA